MAGGLPCRRVRQGGLKGLPGAWAVLFQRAVGSDPAGCASRLAHRVETAIAFRLHNALGTQNERYFVAVNPTAHSLACLRIGVFVTADAARLATGVGGSPFTGRVSHPLAGEQSFMTSPHRSRAFWTPPCNNASQSRRGQIGTEPCECHVHRINCTFLDAGPPHRCWTRFRALQRKKLGPPIRTGHRVASPVVLTALPPPVASHEGRTPSAGQHCAQSREHANRSALDSRRAGRPQTLTGCGPGRHDSTSRRDGQDRVGR